ncbi:MAG: hypothetical protein U0800_11205 [Isosphaeraceae bacterium]
MVLSATSLGTIVEAIAEFSARKIGLLLCSVIVGPTLATGQVPGLGPEHGPSSSGLHRYRVLADARRHCSTSRHRASRVRF